MSAVEEILPSKMSDIEPAGLQSSDTFVKMRQLLKTRDDTSRFVGLALLKTVLDNGTLSQEPEQIKVLWEALSPKFLDRLLRAPQNQKVSDEEGKDMVDLAVSVLYTFSILLPEDSRRDKRLTERTAPLIQALLRSVPETIHQILQTLLTITSRLEGAAEMLVIQDINPLVEIASQYSMVLQIFNYMWINSSTDVSRIGTVRESINTLIPALVTTFKSTDAVTLLNSIADLLPNLAPDVLPQDPKWLNHIILMLRKLVASKPTAVGRTAYTLLAAASLQVFPTTCPDLLFRDAPSGNPDSKPFSYLFVNLLLIDLRSSFPSLLPRLNSDEYPTLSQRLAAAFDIVSSFIGFLVRSLDDETISHSFSMAPDLLLKLRKDIAETMSLNIEYLRDRWDASIAGASGLHPSARTGTAATSEGTRLTLTWESMKDDVSSDPLILAGIRALSIWIREDDNENLRNETAGLMDMLVELYKTGSTGKLDFRYPILLALEGIMITEDGVEGFLGQDGWAIISEDLHSICRSMSELSNDNSIFANSEASRGLQVIRVLLAVIDHQSTSYPREEWMSSVIATTGLKIPSSVPTSEIIEFYIAMLQLSAALLTKSAGGVTKRYITKIAALSGLVNQVQALVTCLDNVVDSADFMGLLEDVSLDLENLQLI